MGPGAEFRDHRALHDRGGLRGLRRDRPRRHGRPPGRTRRPAAAGRVPFAHGGGDGAFAFGDVVNAITSKMIRRHPHVFGDADDAPAGAKGPWDRIKAEEKVERAARRPPEETMDQGLSRRDSGRASRLTRAWNCSRRRRPSASTGTRQRRCSPRSARRPTRSKRPHTGKRRTRGRNRRPHVRARQSRPPCRRRSGSRPCRHQRKVRTSVCLYRACARGEGPFTRREHRWKKWMRCGTR